MKVSQDMRKKNATNSNLKLCHLNGDKAMEMWLVQSDKVCTHVEAFEIIFHRNCSGNPEMIWSCLRGIFILHHGKSASNHHLGKYLLLFPTMLILSKSKMKVCEMIVLFKIVGQQKGCIDNNHLNLCLLESPLTQVVGGTQSLCAWGLFAGGKNWINPEENKKGSNLKTVVW